MLWGKIQMKKKLEQLTDKMDDLLMMDFRQENWNAWVKFCKRNGYEPSIRPICNVCGKTFEVDDEAADCCIKCLKESK